MEADFVWEVNNKKIYNLLLSHCTESMHARLQSMTNWKEISKKQDGLELMILICKILHHKDETEQSVLESLQPNNQSPLTAILRYFFICAKLTVRLLLLLEKVSMIL